MTDDVCLRCVLKHLLKATGYIEEAVSFGMDSNLDVSKLNNIMLELVRYIQKNKK